MTTRRDHVLRDTLPWRPAATRTECGRAAADLPTIARSQWAETMREVAEQVALWRKANPKTLITRIPGHLAPNICQVCDETARRWPTWRDNPAVALRRIIEDEAVDWGRGRGASRIDLELRVLAGMYQASPMLFAELYTEAGGEVAECGPISGSGW